jgi:hypothetical protein
MFREYVGKTGFPGLVSGGRAKLEPCGGEDASRRKKLDLGGSKMGDIGYTDRMLGSKMEIPVEWLAVAGRCRSNPVREE